jgi:hypothetical protein
LAWDPVDGFLYGAALDNKLYKINVGTGDVTLIGTMVLADTSTHSSIAFDASGQLYATSALDNSTTFRFHTVDKSNAQATFIADFSSVGIGNFGLGAARLPAAVPAVSEWLLLAMTLLGLVAGTILFGRRRLAW